MSRLTLDGTAEPASRGSKFSGANRDREKNMFPVLQLTTSRTGNLLTHLILTYMNNVIDTCWRNKSFEASRLFFLVEPAFDTQPSFLLERDDGVCVCIDL